MSLTFRNPKNTDGPVKIERKQGSVKITATDGATLSNVLIESGDDEYWASRFSWLALGVAIGAIVTSILWALFV